MVDSMFMVRCKTPIVLFERWMEIYSEVRKNKQLGTNFGYGIKVNVCNYVDLQEVRKILPFRDHFFFLISNARNREFPIHVDGIPGKLNAASVNWPLVNCNEYSPTVWYRCDDPIFKNIANSYFLENASAAKQIHTETMVSSHKLPYLFRGEILHRGYCNIPQKNEHRIILKWELDFDNWDEACSEFHNRNYI